MLNQGFTVFVSLIHTCRDFLPAFTVTFTTAPFRTEAAYGCLKPVPTNRLRRTYLHLGYSIVLNEHVLGTSHHGCLISYSLFLFSPCPFKGIFTKDIEHSINGCMQRCVVRLHKVTTHSLY